MRVWPLFAGLLAAACQFDGGLGTGLLCPSGECPAGQVCRDGVCTVGGGEAADAAIDGSVRSDDSGSDASGEANLVINPGMEDGTASWTAYNGNHSSTGEPHGGEMSLLVCADVSPDFTVYQDIIHPPDPVPQGASFAARVWIRAQPDEPEPATVMLTIRERGGDTDLLDHDSQEVVLDAIQWVELQVSATVQEPDRENLIFIVWGLGATAGDCFAVDDASMVPQ